MTSEPRPAERVASPFSWVDRSPDDLEVLAAAGVDRLGVDPSRAMLDAARAEVDRWLSEQCRRAAAGGFRAEIAKIL